MSISVDPFFFLWSLLWQMARFSIQYNNRTVLHTDLDSHLLQQLRSNQWTSQIAWESAFQWTVFLMSTFYFFLSSLLDCWNSVMIPLPPRGTASYLRTFMVIYLFFTYIIISLIIYLLYYLPTFTLLSYFYYSIMYFKSFYSWNHAIFLVVPIK